MAVEKMDVRLQERKLRKGAIDRHEVKQHLDGLKDVTENAEWIDYESMFEAEKKAQEESQGETPEAPMGFSTPTPAHVPPLAAANPPVPSPAEGGPAAPIPPDILGPSTDS